MKQLRENKAGGHPQKKNSSSGKDSKTPTVQTPDIGWQINILNQKLLGQKRSPQVLSSMGGGAAGSADDAKRRKLLPEVNSPSQESEEESDDSDYERVESDNDVSDTTESDEDDGDETDSDASESSNEDPEETASQPSSRPDLTKELSSVSFEELLQMRNQVGMKAYQQMTSKKRPPDVTETKKRPCLSKNRPLETSAKLPVPFLRQVVPVKKKVSRDPRFDDLSGEYKPEVFEKTYSFLNDVRKKEKEVIQKQLKKSQNVEEQNKLQQLLKRMTQQEEAQRKYQKKRENSLAFKRQQRELAKQGKKPFFLKKSEMQKMELAEKYKQLKKSGKLESFLNKKRKRNAAKDKRKLPFRKDS
ncbi:ribosomal RNA processing protein 36 homolog [Crotalus tigris]|uniref:ribosomal RNA processing protein 36 homolog n=1 Tax=Crotalus tigris TaxID=88082 RepID=UPI00192F71FA|nr:ribosomal RNA processing protein 36 homolog [Crotalus tigris]XP_039180443.1 ribosomal RNA processing protein 36 homolog [Crotalus tigris]XP_039180444.1 ribosomal RNA processing protein 36 homolog [Crotalus tigris]